MHHRLYSTSTLQVCQYNVTIGIYIFMNCAIGKITDSNEEKGSNEWKLIFGRDCVETYTN